MYTISNDQFQRLRQLFPGVAAHLERGSVPAPVPVAPTPPPAPLVPPSPPLGVNVMAHTNSIVSSPVAGAAPPAPRKRVAYCSVYLGPDQPVVHYEADFTHMSAKAHQVIRRVLIRGEAAFVQSALLPDGGDADVSYVQHPLEWLCGAIDGTAMEHAFTLPAELLELTPEERGKWTRVNAIHDGVRERPLCANFVFK